MKRPNLLLGIGSSMLAVVILAAAFAGVISSHAPTEQLYRDLALAPPSWAHWIGVDGVGRDVLTRILYGARATLGIAFGATAIAVLGELRWEPPPVCSEVGLTRSSVTQRTSSWRSRRSCWGWSR